MPVPRNQHRTSPVPIRFRPEERARLAGMASELDTSISELVRRAALGLKLPDPPRPKVDREAVIALNKLGANLWRAMQAQQDLRPTIQPLLEEITALKIAILGVP